MKKVIIALIVSMFLATSVFALGGGSVDYETETDSLESGSWVTVHNLRTTRYESFATIITNNTVGSVMAYKIEGYIYPDTTDGDMSYIADSTRITGDDYDYIEYSPNMFGRVLIKVFNVSDSVNYQVDAILKNPSDR